MIDQDVFIFEFVSGGGFNSVDIPSSLLCEGYAMLRSLINDFYEFGFNIKTLLDERMRFYSTYLKSDKILLVKSTDSFIKRFSNMLKDNSYCFLIAPEFSNILYNLTKLAIKENNILLSQNLQFIKKGTSKVENYNYFKTNGLPTPKTYGINLNEAENLVKKLYKNGKINFPLIIKPIDGAGAENLHKVSSIGTLKPLISQIEKEKDLSKILIQEFVDGIDLSASILGQKNLTKHNEFICKLLSLNFQKIVIKNKSGSTEYLGGYTPYRRKKSLTETIQNYIDKLKIPNMSGYFGIDFIQTDRNLFFIEINPRLTTSYLGLRNVLNFNPAKLIYEAKTNQLSKIKLETKGNSVFKRIEMRYNGTLKKKDIINKIIPKLMREIPEVITPPLSIEHDPNHYSCLIATKEKNLTFSEKRIEEIIEYLKNDNFVKIEL
jgi:predicted ATP-grasp superfamily ATP-dependent carboligase